MPTLVWPVKAAFVQYVSRVGGTIYVGEGAWLEDDGFAFAGRVDDSGGVMRFRGTIIFDAHGGVLHLELTDPSLEFRVDGTWSLTVSTDESRTTRVRFAEAVETSRGTDHMTFALRLNDVGSTLFGGNYSAGAELDSLTIESIDRAPQP